MFITLYVFGLCTLPFIILSLFGLHVWSYYVPITLCMLVLSLKLIDNHNHNIAALLVSKYPDYFTSLEQQLLLCIPSHFIPKYTFFWCWAPSDFSAAVGWIQILLVIFVICYGFGRVWIPALLLIIPFSLMRLFSLSLAFPGYNALDNRARGVKRAVGSSHIDTIWCSSIYDSLMDKIIELRKERMEQIKTAIYSGQQKEK